MPMTLEEFLAVEPTLAALRKEIETADRHARRPLDDEERSLLALLISRWENGVAGWLTIDEADRLAAELSAIADERGLAVAATVELRPAGEVVRQLLVFSGGPHGQHTLELSVTSPVRARLHWAGYIEAVAPPLPGALPPLEPPPPAARTEQLGLIDTLAGLLRPRRSKGERSRFLAQPLPKARTR